MSVYIRQAAPADIPALVQFEQAISLISFGDEAVTDLALHEKRVRKALAQDPGGMMVLEDEGRVCGWLWMDVKTNFLTQERYINFRSFYLTEDWRGGAEGEALLARGLAYAKEAGARTIVGKVHADNGPMRALYKKAGFAATHITMEYKLES